jgi:hypothetical protein
LGEIDGYRKTFIGRRELKVGEETMPRAI